MTQSTLAFSAATAIAGHIAVIDGRPTTTTRDIAEVYGKRHDSVLLVVRQRMAEVPEEWRLHNFVEAFVEVEGGNGAKASYPVIRMTKKGFHFVVGKFTGVKAVQHQIAFADEFERMETELRTPKKPRARVLAAPAPIGLLSTDQAKEITDRLDRLGRMFHPFSDQFLDVLGITRALRGLHPKLGVHESSFRQLIPRIDR